MTSGSVWEPATMPPRPTAGGNIGPVLENLNCDIILILHPLDVVALEPLKGDLHRQRAEKEYEVDRSCLPSGRVPLDEVHIEFAGYSGGTDD